MGFDHDRPAEARGRVFVTEIAGEVHLVCFTSGQPRTRSALIRTSLVGACLGTVVLVPLGAQRPFVVVLGALLALLGAGAVLGLRHRSPQSTVLSLRGPSLFVRAAPIGRSLEAVVASPPDTRIALADVATIPPTPRGLHFVMDDGHSVFVELSGLGADQIETVRQHIVDVQLRIRAGSEADASSRRALDELRVRA